MAPRASRSAPGSCPNLDASEMMQFQCTAVLPGLLPEVIVMVIMVIALKREDTGRVA